MNLEAITFEAGPPIDEAVLAWLDRNAGQRTLQLPIEIHGGPLRIQSSWLSSGTKKIEIRLDTGALSIDLPMHLKPFCQTWPCWVWLEGTWGTLMPGSLRGELPVFAVRKVVAPADRDTTHVRVGR